MGDRPWGPADLDKVGECVLSTYYCPETNRYQLRIDRADPIIWVSPDVVAELLARQPETFVEVDGDLLTLAGANRTVVYRVGEYVPDRHVYVCRWPD